MLHDGAFVDFKRQRCLAKKKQKKKKKKQVAYALFHKNYNIIYNCINNDVYYNGYCTDIDKTKCAHGKIASFDIQPQITIP